MKDRAFLDLCVARLTSQSGWHDDSCFGKMAEIAFITYYNNHKVLNLKYEKPSPWNVDHCTHFYVFLARVLWQHGQRDCAEKVYFFTRTTFNLDIYPSRNLPENFHFVHPLGTILGAAEYGNRIVFYQCVTVGGNPKDECPRLGTDIILYAGSKILGRSVVGDNSVIGANVLINDEVIPENTIVYKDPEGRNQYRVNIRLNRKVFFK